MRKYITYKGKTGYITDYYKETGTYRINIDGWFYYLKSGEFEYVNNQNSEV